MKRVVVMLLVCLCSAPLSQAGTDLTVHCQGEGAQLYLVGGGPGFTTWHLAPVQARLASRYRVCRWDMRGVGDNAGLPIDPDMTVIAQWLDDMARVLPEEPVILWGHSWGALQVLLFAQAHPQRGDRLILSNPVDPALASLEHIEEKRYRHAVEPEVLTLDAIDTPVEDLHRLRSKIASYFTDAERGWAYARGFTQADANNVLNVRVWEEYRLAPLTDAAVQRLGQRIIGGIYCRHDVLQPEALAAYRRLLPAHTHRVLAGCAHFPWEENAAEYFDALFGLLETGR